MVLPTRLGASCPRVESGSQRRDDGEGVERGQRELVEQRLQRLWLAKVEHVCVEADLEAAERRDDDIDILGRELKTEGVAREGERNCEMLEIGKVLEEQCEIEGHVTIKGEARYLREDGAGDDVD